MLRRIIFIVFIWILTSSNAYTSELFDAYVKADLEGMKKALKNGENVDMQDSNGNTLLIIAAYNNHSGAVGFLIDNGANTEARTSSNKTPLMVAAENGRFRSAAQLLHKGANVNSTTNRGHTSLTLAAAKGHRNIVELLIKNNADFTKKSNDGTAFDIAIKNKNLHLAKIIGKKMLEYYSSPGAKGNINAMVQCIHILNNINAQNEIYNYLKILENNDFQKHHNLQPVNSKPTSSDILLISLYKTLIGLYLVGNGVEQNFQKAKHLYNLVGKSIPAMYPLKNEYFDTPTMQAAQYPFWEISQSIPGSEYFLVKALPFERAQSKLRNFLEEKTLKERTEFYKKYYNEENMFHYEMALYSFDTFNFNQENINNVKAILAKSKPSEKVTNLLNSIPENLKDTNKLEQLINIFNTSKIMAPKPMWLAAIITNKIDDKILETKLDTAYIYTQSDKEKDFIREYEKNEQEFVKKVDHEFIIRTNSDITNEYMHKLMYTIYMDKVDGLFEMDKDIFRRIEVSLLSYPPFMLYFSGVNMDKSYKSSDEKEHYQEQAEFYLINAAEMNYPPAMVEYGRKLAYDAENRQPIKGFEYILRAAQMGYANAFYSLTSLPNNGGDEKARNISLLTKAAKLGDATAATELKTKYDIDFAVNKIASLANNLKNNNLNMLSDNAYEMLLQGKTYEESLIGAALHWYLATHENGGQANSTQALAIYFYEGKIFPQDFEKAFSFYKSSYDIAPPRYKGDCGIILPMTEMYIFGLGVKQNIPQAEKILKTYNHCKSPWAKELAQKSIPKFEKSNVIRKEYPLRSLIIEKTDESQQSIHTRWSNKAKQQTLFTPEDVQKIIYLGSSKRRLANFIKNIPAQKTVEQTHEEVQPTLSISKSEHDELEAAIIKHEIVKVKLELSEIRKVLLDIGSFSRIKIGNDTPINDTTDKKISQPNNSDNSPKTIDDLKQELLRLQKDLNFYRKELDTFNKAFNTQAKNTEDKVKVSDSKLTTTKKETKTDEAKQATPATTPTISPTAPAPKKPGVAVIIPTSTDIMSLTTFAPDKKQDSCVQVVALNKSPLTAVRLETMSGSSASWKTKDVKTKAQGVLAVFQNDKIINVGDASFALDISNETPLSLCVQDNGVLADKKNRMRVIFFHEDGTRNYSVLQP